MTSIAVTGASGFIGRHVLARLAALPVDVIAVSRRAQPQSQINRLRWVEFDISKPPKNSYVHLGRPDVLLHLAWDGLPDYRGAAHIDSVLPAHKTFLRKMIEGGLAALTVAGTCLEYGMQTGQLSERAPCDPILAYPQAKLQLLDDLRALRQTSSYSLTWARLFYTYGEGQQDRSLYSQFMAAHANGDKRFDMSGGEQLRDFLPVETLAARLCDLALTTGDHDVVNLCSGEPISVRALVEGWARELGWDVELNLGAYPYPDYEPMEFWGDNRRLNEVLAPA